MKPSMKKSILVTMTNANTTKELQDNKIIFITALGLLSCNSVDIEFESPEDDVAALFYGSIEKTGQAFFDETNGEDADVMGNDGYMRVRNAVINAPGNQTYTIGNAIVFYDQIIGVSYGNYQKAPQ